jgi:phage baseplate assembly protein W
MPYKNLEITPSNYNSQHTARVGQIYKGFSTVDPTNYGAKLYDFDLIKQDIINQFHTRKGQRVMNPTFGTIIWDLLMEPLTEQVKEALTTDITNICNADPRVYPMQIKINEEERGYFVEITLAMKNTNQTTVLRLQFDQQVGLRAE